MKRPRVLVTPLDWGLGHSTRCIPIIRELIKQNCEVIIGGSGDSLALLKNEFPSLKFFNLPAYAPVYSTSSSIAGKMIQQLGKFRKTIRKEHDQIELLVGREKIDLVISDNRYGCWSRNAKSIFITHQLTILMPSSLKWMERMVNYFNHRLIRKFDECWVPDHGGEESFAGVLSRTVKLRTKYIGPLSRFETTQATGAKTIDVLIVLSGPEPQRSILEEKLLANITTVEKTICLVRGVPGNKTKNIGKHITIVDFLNSSDLQSMIRLSRVLIARSGYSTIMDLSLLGGKVIFIPTPGQTEQEYLAERFKEKGIAPFIQQEDFDWHVALSESEKYPGFIQGGNNGLLREAIQNVLSFDR